MVSRKSRGSAKQWRPGKVNQAGVLHFPPGRCGWSHGGEVTLIGFDHGYVSVVGDGKETTVFIVNIDSGWDEWVDGKWRERD